MTRGMTDLIGVIGLKASTYKIVEENARWGANSYFYSLEPGAQSEKKSLYHLESIGDSHKPFFTSLGNAKYVYRLGQKDLSYLLFSSLIQFSEPNNVRQQLTYCPKVKKI